MRTWARAVRPLFCGYCGDEIRRGEPVLEIRLQGTRFKHGEAIGVIDVKRVLYRCSKFACAKEAIPQDLPPLPERLTAIVPQPMLRLGADALPLDFKTRQHGGE